MPAIFETEKTAGFCERERFEIGEIVKTEKAEGMNHKYLIHIRLLTVDVDDAFKVEDIQYSGSGGKGTACVYYCFPGATSPGLYGSNPVLSKEDGWYELAMLVRKQETSFLKNTRILVSNRPCIPEWKWEQTGNAGVVRKDDKTTRERWMQMMPISCWSDLDSCVQYAAVTGDHLAFARYFTERAMSRREIFFAVFHKYTEEYERKYGSGSWLNLKLLQSSLWRALNLLYTEEIILDSGVAYNRETLKKWENEKIPDRDALIQCAVAFNLSSAETDALLMLAGYKRLYILDEADWAAGYYLDYFQVCNREYSVFDKLKKIFDLFHDVLRHQCENGTFREAYADQKIKIDLTGQPPEQLKNDTERKLLELMGTRQKQQNGSSQDDLYDTSPDVIFDGLRKIGSLKYEKKILMDGHEEEEPKKTITRFYIEIWEDENPHVRWTMVEKEERKIRRKNGKSEIVSRSAHRTLRRDVTVLTAVSEKPMGKDLMRDIKSLRAVNKDDEKESAVTDTEYPTMLAKREFAADIAAGESITGKWLTDRDRYRLFSHRHYAYLKKCLQFIDDYPLYDRNLRRISLTRWKRNPWMEASYYPGMKEVMDILKKNPRNSELIDKKLEAVSFVWDRRSELMYPGHNPQAAERRSTARNMIHGRERSRTNEQSGKGYERIISYESKENFMKWLVVTGHEDDIGICMKKTGFWPEDLYHLHGNLQTDPRFYTGKPETCICDRKDLLMIYALRYRDAVLDSILSDTDGSEQIKKKNILKKRFPFIQLLIEIGDTILWEKYHEGGNSSFAGGEWKFQRGDEEYIVYPEDLMFFEPVKKMSKKERICR